MRYLLTFVMVINWVLGIIVANGFWSTLAAVVLPPWGVFLGIEHFLYYFGVL